MVSKHKSNSCCLALYKTTMVMAGIVCMLSLVLLTVNHIAYELSKDDMPSMPPVMMARELTAQWFERKANHTRCLETMMFYKESSSYVFGNALVFIVIVTYVDFILRR